MDESEKMVALKKAYAEIILNTAKEAAARVMASERRALRCQRDLSAAKDDSLCLLLRLKKMVDDKECGAEINAIRQRRRIDELEAQLQVAEEKILDLRVELRNVSDEVENEKKKSEMQLFSGVLAKEDMVVLPEDEMPEDHLKNPEPIVPYSSDSELESLAAAAVVNGAFRQSVQDQNTHDATVQAGQVAVSPLQNYMGHSSKISSIIMRSAEPDLCRNGCTQRIRAFERQHPDVTVAAGEVGDGCISATSELKLEAREKNGVESALTFQKASSLEDGKNLPEERTKKPKLQRRRRRKFRFTRSKSSSRRSCPHQLVRCSQSSFFGDCNLPNGNTKVGEAVPAELSAVDSKQDLQEGSAWLQEKLHNNNNPSTESKIAKTIRKRKVVRRKSIANSLDASIRSEKICLDISKDEAEPLLLLSKNTEDSPAVQDVPTFVKEQKLAHESRLAQKKSDAAEVPDLPIGDLDQEDIDGATRNSNSEDAEGPSKAKDSRLLKYTFHRKRKKDFSNSLSDSASPEKGNLEKLAMDREDVGQESKRSRVEPSRTSRRLAQVARQLISLSGKRW